MTSLARSSIWAAAAVVARTNGPHLANLRWNLSCATGKPVGDRLAAAAIASYLRTWTEVAGLPRWQPDQIVSRVVVPDAARLRRRQAESGAIVVLPHSANWDLAGAWACLSGFPVTTVVEVLSGGAYEDFLAFRRGLGLEPIGHREPDLLNRLASALERGRTVCLVADRDLTGSGLIVDWAGHSVRMPSGPARLARLTGAALIPGVCQFLDQSRMQIQLGPEVHPDKVRKSAAGEIAELTAMTQQVADFFSAQIRRHPHDWPMLQPFFGPALVDAIDAAPR